jgi:hypothetical protein
MSAPSKNAIAGSLLAALLCTPTALAQNARRPGGEEWEKWNARLSTVLPAAQAKDGSFPPIGVYADEAGDSRRDRSYTTAMCVLSLEVYYRYFTPLLLGR